MLKKTILMILFVAACLISTDLVITRWCGFNNYLVKGFINGAVLVFTIFLGNILIFKYRLKKK